MMRVFTAVESWGTTVTGQYHVINIIGGTVNLQNLTVNGDWDKANEDATESVNTVNAARSGINVWTSGGSKATVNLSNVKVENNSVYGVVVNGTGSVVNATDLTVANSNRWGVNADQGGTFNMISGTVDADFVVENSKNTDSGKAVITNGTFTGAVKTQGNNVAEGALLINGGNFKETVTESTDTSSTDSISITGGSFVNDISNYCATGFTVTGSDNSWTVEVATDMVAQLLDSNGNVIAAYDSLSDALSTADSGQTVVLLKDATLASTIKEGVILQVPEDKTLTVSNPSDVASSTGTMRVNAGGAIVVGTTEMIGDNTANLNLTDGYVDLTMTGTTALNLSFVDADVEIPTGYRWTMALSVGKNTIPMNATLDENSTLTVTATGDASTAQNDGFRVANNATLTNNGMVVVNGVMSISSDGKVLGDGFITVNSNGVLEINTNGNNIGTLGNNVTNRGTVVYNGTANNSNITGPITLASGGKVYSQADIAAKLSGAEELSDKSYDGTDYEFAWQYDAPSNPGGGGVTSYSIQVS